ncbi:MAG: Fic family protein, partial [Cytophagaceae bacterium]
VFEQVDKAVDFVLSKISTSVGLRTDSAQAPVQYEIPRPVIAEAMVNAIAHRDYNSNASVQVMLFSDRLEIFNPGSLVPQLNIQKLKTDHASYPTNPALAEAMYQVGYIERFGTGTGEILRLSKEANLKEPFFDLDEGFKVILWRPVSQIPHQYPTSTPPVPDKHRTSAGQVPDKYRTSEVEKLVSVVSGEMKASEIQSTLNLKHRETFRDNYLNPSINAGLVEPTIPDKPNSPKQKYRLTASGLQIQQEIKNSL